MGYEGQFAVIIGVLENVCTWLAMAVEKLTGMASRWAQKLRRT